MITLEKANYSEVTTKESKQMKISIQDLEKRYDKGFLEINSEPHHDNTAIYELVYDSCLVATIVEDINGVNDVYKVTGYLNGNSAFSENTYINPSEDELVNAIDEILDRVENR